jgi:hypothetical protein
MLFQNADCVGRVAVRSKSAFANYVINLCCGFMYVFYIFLTLMWSVAFLCLATCPCFASLSQGGLLEVPVTYLRSLSYFPAWGPDYQIAAPRKGYC